jgi:hypothetical protein
MMTPIVIMPVVGVGIILWIPKLVIARAVQRWGDYYKIPYTSCQ